MRAFFASRRAVFVGLVAVLAAWPAMVFAKDVTPPVVVKPLGDLTVAAGTTVSVINLTKTFGLTGVTGTVVRMATVLGDIDIELFNTETPKNAANFLRYVNNGNYNRSFIHRSVEKPTPFVIQGGGYYVGGDGRVNAIPTSAPVAGEHMRPNTRGTLALALSNGPDSGTSQWFFNLVDNPMLDGTSNGGPFTVFGRVIEGGMRTVDAIAALPVFDLSGQLGTAFGEMPLYKYDSAAGLTSDNLVYLHDAVVVPLVPANTGADSLLKFRAKSNNPGLVTATIAGRRLKLTYVPGKTGTARIKVLARDSAGTQTKSQFTVTVQ